MTKRRTDRQLADDIVAKLNSEEDQAAHPGMEINSLLQQARDAGGGALRMQYLETAQREIAKLHPSRHGKLINQLQGEVLALQGRRGDTRVAHVTPGEVVIPERLQTPELLAALRAAAQEAGIDPARLVVGHQRNSINPYTGQAEFQDGPGNTPRGRAWFNEAEIANGINRNPYAGSIGSWIGDTTVFHRLKPEQLQGMHGYVLDARKSANDTAQDISTFAGGIGAGLKRVVLPKLARRVPDVAPFIESRFDHNQRVIDEEYARREKEGLL